MAQRTIILIGGPTASGKSAFAMQLARENGGVIINADAMQVYKGLPLLTAQPTAEDKAEITHLLYEVTDPGEASSAGKWVTQARTAIEKVQGDGRTPILVGGTGLYFNALQGGLADIPAVPANVRAEVSALYDSGGEASFRALLEGLDPVSAVRIALNDRQRLIRAYEVATHTGKSLTRWQQESLTTAPDLGSVTRHLVTLNRKELYLRCDERFDQMMRAGAIAEVKAFIDRKLSPTLPAMKILGLPELTRFLMGEMDLNTAVAHAGQMTRNYAKRQMTWFRNRWASLT